MRLLSRTERFKVLGCSFANLESDIGSCYIKMRRMSRMETSRLAFPHWLHPCRGESQGDWVDRIFDREMKDWRLRLSTDFDNEILNAGNET
jgi:hypothetical protein